MRKFVTYLGAVDRAQATWADCTDPRPILEEGKEYEVEYVDMHSWHTRIKLVGIEGEFNSTCFDTEKMDLAEEVEKIEAEQS